MSDIRKNCPVLNCPAQTDEKIGCWDKSCPKYLAYLQGRTDLAEELLKIENRCDDCYIGMCESCSHGFDYSNAIQEKLEQIKEQKNE